MHGCMVERHRAGDAYVQFSPSWKQRISPLIPLFPSLFTSYRPVAGSNYCYFTRWEPSLLAPIGYLPALTLRVSFLFNYGHVI